jgi:hypothetical protein
MPSGLRWYSTSWVDPENKRRKKIKDLTDTELLDRLNVYERKNTRYKSPKSAPFVYINLLREAASRGLRIDNTES